MDTISNEYANLAYYRSSDNTITANYIEGENNQDRNIYSQSVEILTHEQKHRDNEQNTFIR